METSTELLKIIEKLNFKGYKQDFHRNSNGDYNHLRNFFIWKRTDRKSEYLRITLLSEGWREKTLFYWNLETSFKPFAYEHNHRKDANITSEKFKENETDKYLKYFLDLVNKANKVLKK